VKYECHKMWQSEICVVINDKSHNNTVNHFSCDELVHYKFIVQFAADRIFKIGEHLAKLQAKWLIVSYALFALDFCPQRGRTHRISKSPCILWTETVTDCFFC